MRLLLEVVDDGSCSDVVVDAAPDTTIGELARALFPDAVPPGLADGALGLVVDDGAGESHVASPTVTLERSMVRNGATVRPTASPLATGGEPHVADLVVLDGPDAPAEFPLRRGANSLGRGADCDVRLSDPLVSKRHADVTVDQLVEIVDQGSANGLVMSERVIERAVLHDRDRITLGATTIAVRQHATGGASAPSGPQVPFNRSPRVNPVHAGVRLVAPEPPQPPAPQRFPIATVIAPVVLALVLYAFTRNVLSILFFALSPVLMIGSWWETRSANRKQMAAATARYRTALADLAAQLTYALELERRGRRREHPSATEVVEAIDRRAALLWTRRPEHDSFGQVRLGLGTQPSRTSVEMPSENATLPELWRELTDTVARFVDVDGVPVVADLATCGNVGVAGPDATAAPALRAVIAQLVGLHAPAELQLAGFGGPSDDWGWMTWLPHVDDDRLAGNSAESETVLASLETLVSERLALVGETKGDDALPLPRIVVVVHDRAPADRSRLVQLLERGPAVGVHGIWYAPSVERLPAACRAFVDLDANTGRATAGFVVAGQAVADLAAEVVGSAAARRLGRRLAPLVDAGAPVDAQLDLPRSVPLVELLGRDDAVAPQAFVDRWAANGAVGPSPRGLRAVVGRTTDGPLALDLRTQGPHALVGGTTGSGKSEFLQTWILALAADHSPEQVNFLLVDYKGGAAFADCVELPHCVGLVTDLDRHLVRRALASLEAEVRHREQLLHDRGAKDLVELERRGDAPPSLVIVIDEFAALVAEVPEFVEGVVNVAQRGRSLGLHLVLATQRPAGVVTDNLRANTNLRIALRMADAADSDDVIGSAAAAHFDQDLPGRAIVSAGAGRSTTFQAAYVGGHAIDACDRAPVRISALRFGRPVARATVSAPATAQHGAADIVRLVRTVGAAATTARLDPPRRPWLPALADRYRLELLPSERTDARLVLGVADDPARQTQPCTAFCPDLDGNMAVYGTSGTGKSATLRTVAAAAAMAAARGGPVHVYGLDFATHGLRPLESMPHVGSIVRGDDHERVQRLLRLLDEQIDERSARFVTAGSSTIDDHRRRTGDTDARIIVLVDGVGTFRNEYEGGSRALWWDRFVRIAAEGRSVGIHVVMTADRPAAIPSNLAAAVQRELVLRLANDDDYAIAGAPTDAFGAATPPGRGFLDGLEVQIAVPGGAADLATQTSALAALSAGMARTAIATAPPIGTLPTRVLLDDLLDDPADEPGTAVPNRCLFGVDDATLGSAAVELREGMIVAGPARSGVTTTTATLVRSIRRTAPETEFVLLGRRGSPLGAMVAWTVEATGVARIGEVAEKLAGRLSDAGRSVVVVIEDVGDLVDTEADGPIQELLRSCREHGAFVIATGETPTLGGSWPLLQAVKSYRRGIALQPDQMDGDTLFKVPFPRPTDREFPVGRGLLVHDGRVSKVQVAVPE